MTTEKLNYAISLTKRIEELERLIKNGQNQKCDYILFSFGNGSSREVVCDDKDTIEKVKDFILTENKLKLMRLKDELAEL